MNVSFVIEGGIQLGIEVKADSIPELVESLRGHEWVILPGAAVHAQHIVGIFEQPAAGAEVAADPAPDAAGPALTPAN